MSTPQDAWTASTGEHNGRPLFVRLNTTLRDIAGKPPFDHRFGVAVPFHSPSDDGLPGDSESEELNSIEDALLAAFDPDKQTILAVVLTTSGFREFLFYTADPHSIPPVMERLEQSIKSHELQFYIRPDADWDGYAQWEG